MFQYQGFECQLRERVCQVLIRLDKAKKYVFPAMYSRKTKAAERLLEYAVVLKSILHP